MTTRSILTLSELLRRGRERILRGWTQHAPARTATGTMCGADDPAAVAWVRGGGRLVQRRHGPRLHQRPVLRAVPRGPGRVSANAGRSLPGRRRLGPWNDAFHRTQADIVRLYDATLARVEARANG